MKTFVINLPSAKERLVNISKQLSNLKIEYEIFPAIYWKKLTEKELRTLYDSKKANKFLWKELTPWEIGCAMSHKWVREKIVRENIPIALVFEDDAIISKKIKKIYNKLKKKKPKYDYILLNYWIFDRKELKRYWWYIYNNFFKKWKIMNFIIHFFWMFFFAIIDYILIFISKIFWPFIIKKYKPSYLMGWYFITKTWAEKLLKVHDKIFVPSDLLPEKFWKSVWLRFALSIPCLVNQNQWFDSCIDAQWKRE